MSASLAQINRIIDEHQSIRGHLKLVGDSVSDQEALTTLKSVRSDLAPHQTAMMSEKLKKLQLTVSFLKEGIRNHFTLETKVLPPILGKVLMQALLREHQEIIKRIDETQSMIADTRPEKLSHDGLSSKEADLAQMTNSLCRLIEEHAEKEELMLEMAKQALQEKG